MSAAVAFALLTVVWLIGAAPASALGSPGFKPVKGLGKATPRALPSITLGTGKYPNLLVDAAGTAHIVYTQDGGASAPDTLAFCGLQRGIKQCAASGTAPNPQAPGSGSGGAFLGNLPAGNHDYDGAAPLVIGNQLYVVERRFPDVFPTPAGTSDSNVFEWSSSDGGQTLTGPGIIGDNQMAGGAVAFGDRSGLSIGTISDTETGGTFFQGTAPGVYNTAKAQLGTGDQAYNGSLAADLSGSVIRPVAAFADLSGNVFVREWSGQGDVNDPATWSETSLPGFSPHIIGGASGVFLLSSDSRINGGHLTLRRIVGGQPSGAAVSLGTSASPAAISEDASGEISFAYTDRFGVEVRTSSDGVNFSSAQFTAAAPNGGSIGHLVTAAAGDGGGFVSFVQNPSGGEGVGQIVVAAFGTQVASGKPGLGALPGGGIGSSVGDQLATSTCQSAKFGAVDAEVSPRGAGCFSRDPQDPNMVVSFGTIDLNGLLIIPDAGTKIGVDPKAHKIQTTGSVQVVLRTNGIPDITLYHGPLTYDVPNDGPGDPLFSPYFNGVSASKILGFPIDGDIDIKLAHGGVDIPISLGLPSYLGGVTGSATLHAASFAGLSVDSLEFKIADANLVALELKDVDVKYQVDGDMWSGAGELQVPAGGSGFDLKLAVDFQNGRWTHGLIDAGLPWPGIPLDDVDPAPAIYLSHGGLDLRFEPSLTLTGLVGIGAIPVPPVSGMGGPHDYVFSLDGSLGVSFGSPVTLTANATGFLFGISVAQATLTYKMPYLVSLTGHAGYSIDPISFDGDLQAFVDAGSKSFGGSISATVKAFGLTVDKAAIAVNNMGFAVYVSPQVVPPFPGGSIVDYWGQIPYPVFGKDVTGRFVSSIPAAAGDRPRARAAVATAFTIPAGTPSATLIVHGSGGAPTVALVDPSGRQVPVGGQSGPGELAIGFQDPSMNATSVAIGNPEPGKWTVIEAAGSQIPITSVDYAMGEAPPTVSATVTGRGMKRTLHYHAKLSANTAITFVEETGSMMHVIGVARGTSGSISFRPGHGPAGRRQIVAEITNGGAAFSNQTLGSYLAPAPPRPGRAGNLHVHAGAHAFTYSFRAPANANRVLIKIAATDGRHLERTVSPTTHSGSVPALVRGDGVTITVVGLGNDGSHGPAAKASAKQAIAKPRRPGRR